MATDLTELVKLYAELIYLFFYPLFIVVIVVYLNLGVYSWLVIAAFLMPPTVAWYYVLKRRMERYLDALLKNQVEFWDTDKLCEEYIELLTKKKVD